MTAGDFFQSLELHCWLLVIQLIGHKAIAVIVRCLRWCLIWMWSLHGSRPDQARLMSCQLRLEPWLQLKSVPTKSNIGEMKKYIEDNIWITTVNSSYFNTTHISYFAHNRAYIADSNSFLLFAIVHIEEWLLL